VDELFERWGGLDVLINNAGIGMRTVNPRFLTDPQPFWEVPAGGFRDVIETKVTGVFLLARAVAPRMLAAGGGRIINISMSAQTMTRRGSCRTGRRARASRHFRGSWPPISPGRE
jgi:NAD(P)-dependent dehydrogenase (short-subunit alcohol dehydrogenase family)